MRLCEVKGCNKKHYGKGLCVMQWRHGSTDTSYKAWNYGKDCSVDECNNKARKRRMCEKHYDAWMKKRDPKYKRKRQLYEQKPEVKERRKAYYQKTKEKTRIRKAAYWKTPKGKAIERNKNAMRRAAIKETDITKEFLQELWDKTKICGICLKPLEEKRHLDHIIPIIPSCGGKHTKNNVRYVHPHCNLSRPKNGGDLSMQQLYFSGHDAIKTTLESLVLYRLHLIEEAVLLKVKYT